MQQQFCQSIFTSLARSVLCLVLIVPICDYAEADDESRNSHSTSRNVSGTSVNSSGHYYGLRGRTSADINSAHRNTNSNAYHYGLNRTHLASQDQRKKGSIPGKENMQTENTGTRQSTGSSQPVSSRINQGEPERHNKITNINVQQEQGGTSNNNVSKISGTSGPTTRNRQNKYQERQNNSISVNRKYYDNSRRDNDYSSDRRYSRNYDRNRQQAGLHHDHHVYHHNYRKHKKYVVRRYPLNKVFFIGYTFIPYSYYAYCNYYYPGILTYSPPPGYAGSNYFYGPDYKRESSGWVQLANGQIMAALESFSREMKYYPDAGIPKVGYALAVAASGNLTSAVLAMREALRNDPDSLQYLYLDDKLLGLVDSLIEKYEYPLQFDDRHPDEAFMVSALFYLEQDYISAHDAIGRAISDGDRSVSVNNLHEIINAKLQENYAGEYNQVH